MVTLIQWFFAPAIFISLVLSLTYSFKSRRAEESNQRGVITAKMNISMGSMLIFMAAAQFFLSNESTLRIIIGSLFLVVGLFNLFAGLRNLSTYRRIMEQSTK
ncbi:YtpI family protein [Paenibacillus yanchengensis]|uniref:YtpI family protein n=1 Tax=Paenibacillus yanchengensis TaxID=2035833 RepID=A0ABW4YLY1_9BACL